MPGDTCIVCGNTRAKDKSVSMHHFPRDEARRQRWIEALDLNDLVIKDYNRVCSRHFPNADAKNDPQLTLGKRFASPKKHWTGRAKRAKKREETARQLSFSPPLVSPSSSRSPTPVVYTSASPTPPQVQAMVTSVGEQLDTDYHVYELPGVSKESSPSAIPAPSDSTGIVVNAALLARIEALESQNRVLTNKLQVAIDQRRPFKLDDIAGNDKLVQLYTGFSSHDILLAFFEFLGSAVTKLNYRGEKRKEGKRHRQRKLDPLNQFFLILIKLKLKLRSFDLAVRFGISESLVSRYVITWVCFMYQHLKEIEWMPAVEQVASTLPPAFREKYPTTYAIIDGSEMFIETPSDLHMQSSTWSSYKHHNTAKFLIACTPNGAICYMSPLYVGSISDVELTRVSGFIQKLEGRNGISIMADRGFTIKDQLQEIGVDLNIPPFLEGRQQLPSEEVQRGRQIASVRIHVERAIGRIKNLGILNGTFPLSMARVANQVVCVCAWLSNFQPALIAAPTELSETDVDKYFQAWDDSDCCSDSDSDNDQ